jgi:MoaA/NifB/PqqE/SkfB family radical SAM enzyme
VNNGSLDRSHQGTPVAKRTNAADGSLDFPGKDSLICRLLGDRLHAKDDPEAQRTSSSRRTAVSGDEIEAASAKPRRPGVWATVRSVLREGGPGFCQFALTNACNANCGFCNFARDRLPKSQWHSVERQGAFDAIEILARHGISYLVLTGGEPTLHPDVTPIIRHAAERMTKVMLVTNGGLLKPHRIREFADAGLSSFVISVDAASAAAHEQNRGLPGVCQRIRAANQEIARLGLHATASVTMSHLVDYERLPQFLADLGFDSVTFSYPLTYLASNFLGYSKSELVHHTREELIATFDRIKALKKRMLVVNPTPSLDEMQRYLRREPQRFPCLGGYRFFYLDWRLDLWRCHYWEEPMCSIYEFDETRLVRDGCTRCMIDCYRDSSAMQHVAVSAHDGWRAIKGGRVREAARALTRTGNWGSIKAVLEELPWLVRF